MIMAGQWAMVSDDEQDEDWMYVEVEDGLVVTFVRQSAMEDHPGEVADAVVRTVLDSFRPPPVGARRAVA